MTLNLLKQIHSSFTTLRQVGRWIKSNPDQNLKCFPCNTVLIFHILIPAQRNTVKQYQIGIVIYYLSVRILMVGVLKLLEEKHNVRCVRNCNSLITVRLTNLAPGYFKTAGNDQSNSGECGWVRVQKPVK